MNRSTGRSEDRATSTTISRVEQLRGDSHRRDGLHYGNEPGLDQDRVGSDERMIPQPLSAEQIEEISTLLRAGRRLPPHLFPHLFETPREYQLV